MNLSSPLVVLCIPMVIGCSSEPRSTIHAPTGAPSSASTATVLLEAEPGTLAETTLSLRDCPAPPDLGVRIIGRHDGCDPSGVRIGWSGSGFVGRFSGTGVRMRHSGPVVHYTVLIDGAPMPDVITKGGAATYPLALGLASGEHSVEMYRRGEASFGAAVLHGFEVVDGRLHPPPPPRGRRIEVVGDSISCGYGNEGTSTACHFTAETENHYLAYGSVLGRLFDAEVSTVAWSGKGIVVNYSAEPGPTMPDLYESAVPTDAPSRWRFEWKPELVIVNLGTNDYSTDVDPSDSDFTRAYAALLEVMRRHAPEAFILCTIGPMLSGADLATAQSTIRAAVERRKQAGDSRVAAYELRAANENPGCDWHPSVAVHEAIARELGGVISGALGWTMGS